MDFLIFPDLSLILGKIINKKRVTTGCFKKNGPLFILQISRQPSIGFSNRFWHERVACASAPGAARLVFQNKMLYFKKDDSQVNKVRLIK